MMEPASEPSTGYSQAPPSAPVDPTYASQQKPPVDNQGMSRFPAVGGSAMGKIGSPIVILILVLWHFFWSSWANIQFVDTSEQVSLMWLPVAWFFHTYCLLGVGVWAVADHRSISALAFMLFLVISIFTEWIMFGIYFDHSKEWLDNNNSGSGSRSRIDNAWHFAWGAALINHLTKYVSTIILALAFMERGGGVTIMAQRRNYDEIPGSYAQ